MHVLQHTPRRSFPIDSVSSDRKAVTGSHGGGEILVVAAEEAGEGRGPG